MNIKGYELRLDTYVARIIPVGSKWAVQVWDNETQSNILPTDSDDASHYEDTLDMAQTWGCRRLSQLATTALNAGASDPCEHFDLHWEPIL
jgi:hypothetical protein